MYLFQLILTNVLSMVDITERKTSSLLLKLNQKQSIFLLDSIATLYTHGISITNNIFYKIYRTAIVLTGRYHSLVNNLVSTIYWSGLAKPEIATYNFKYDGAVMSFDAFQITMTVCIFC